MLSVIQSDLYIKATQGNLKNVPLIRAVPLYLFICKFKKKSLMGKMKLPLIFTVICYTELSFMAVNAIASINDNNSRK
jgi:hypothetical protein